MLYYVFKVDFDPVALLSDSTQSGWGGSLNHEVLGQFRRLGGMYNEPGTYATFVSPLVALFALIQNATSPGRRRDDFLLLGSIVSLVLTFSIFAWVFCAIIVGVVVAKSPRKIVAVVPLLPVAIWLATPYVIYRFFDSAGNGSDGGLSFRKEIWDNIVIFVTESPVNMMFGIGMLTDQVPFTFYGAINDVGLIPYSLLFGGLAGTSILVFLIAKSGWRLGISGIATCGILLTSKISIFAPMFWLLLALSAHTGLMLERERVRTQKCK